MTDLELWALVTGAMLPPFIAVLQQPTWSPAIRAIVTVLVCAVVGGFTAWLNHEWSEGGAVHAILTTLVAAWTAYKHFWVPLGVAPAIEHATALPAPPAEPLNPPPGPSDT